MTDTELMNTISPIQEWESTERCVKLTNREWQAIAEYINDSREYRRNKLTKLNNEMTKFEKTDPHTAEQINLEATYWSAIFNTIDLTLSKIDSHSACSEIGI